MMVGEAQDILDEMAKQERIDTDRKMRDAEIYYSLRRTGDLYKKYSYSDMFVTQQAPPDITNLILGILFPPIPENGVTWKHGCFVGWPGCGKTELFKFLVYYALKIYGKENVNVCYCNDLAIAIDRIDSRPVQLMIIDDATRCANSLNMMDREQMDSATIFQQLRHEYEDVSGKKNGIVICLFGWQRWMELRKSYRSGHVVIFKTGVAEHTDEIWMIKNLGWEWYNSLMRISSEILKENNKMKSLSIGYVPVFGKANGIGYFRSRLVNLDMPFEMLTRENYKFQRRDPAAVLEAQRDKSALEDWEIETHRKTMLTAYGDAIRYANLFQGYYIDRKPILELSLETSINVDKIEKMIKYYRQLLRYSYVEECEIPD